MCWITIVHLSGQFGNAPAMQPAYPIERDSGRRAESPRAGGGKRATEAYAIGNSDNFL
jgi:hypothetical protein